MYTVDHFQSGASCKVPQIPEKQNDSSLIETKKILFLSSSSFLGRRGQILTECVIEEGEERRASDAGGEQECWSFKVG